MKANQSSKNKSPATTNRLIEAMTEPGFYFQKPRRVECRETHISHIFLTDDIAYKVKKSLSLPFIDCSTLEKRRQHCINEVIVNRRLSPDVYLGVVPLIYRDTGYALGESIRPEGVVVDYAVKMRRLADEDRLDHKIAAGTATVEDIRRISKHLASFHNQASTEKSWIHGSADRVSQLVIGNLLEAEKIAPTRVHDVLGKIEDFSRRFIAAHRRFLDQRACNARVRECHGDLRADSIYLTSEGIKILDALEFSEQLRYSDVASEIAFLAMDLDRLQVSDHADELVRSYACAAGDQELGIPLSFYKCHRAVVRAKVEIIRGDQDDISINDRALARERASNYLHQAERYTNVPARALMIFCGLSGTGKSTLANALQERLPAFEIVSSDIERKRLAAIASNARSNSEYGKGIYSEEVTRKVYQGLIQKAAEALQTERSVIIDATFRQRATRRLVIELGRQFQIEPYFVECRANRDEILRRLRNRPMDANQASDANIEIFLQQEFEPLDEVQASHHLIADTSVGPESLVDQIEYRILSPCPERVPGEV